MKQALDPWPLMLGLLTLVGGLAEENATSFISHFTPEGTQSTWDGDIPAINQGLIPEESPESSFLVEGDIIKTSPFQMFSTASFKWPKKDEIVEIPYLFSSKYDQPSREIILEAFADFEHFTCVRFVPRTNQKDFVSIIPMSGCFSSVGHSGGMQVVSLAPFCLQKGKGIVLHEFMHVLGFWHEHSRADRDRYIHISWKEIRPGFEINFIKSQNSNMLVPYDYTSVMHYGRYAFSKNGNTTIMPLAGQDIPIGQRWNLSTSDIIRVNRLYECNQTVKDSGLHSEKKGSHQKLRITDLGNQEEKKLHPTKTPLESLSSLKTVSQPKTGERGSPGWPHSIYSHHPWEKEMAKTTWPTWLISASSGTTQPPELIFPSEAVPWESMKNTPISLNNTETTLLSESVPSSSVPFLKVLSRGKMTSFPEFKLLPETHNRILVEMGERGGLPSTLIPGRGSSPKGTVTRLSGNGSFSLELQNRSPDWRTRPEGTIAEIQTSHPRLGSIPGQLHRCQLCRQKEMTPTVGSVPREGRGFLWHLLKALAMASRNLPNIRGVRAQGPETRDQLFAVELKGNGALPKTLGKVFPAHGTHNPEASEELAQKLMEGRREADSWLTFGDATGVPDVPARHMPSPSTGQGRIWSSWGSRHRYQLSPDKAILGQPRRDNSSGSPVEMHLSGVMSPSNSHGLGWVSSMSPSPRGRIPALRRNNGDFTVPWTVSRNPASLSLGVASSGNREEFASATYHRLPVEKAPSISLERELHSLKISVTQSELGLLNILPITKSPSPSSSQMAPDLFLKSQTNKILAQMKLPLLAAFTSHLSHLMENVTSDPFIFSVPSRKTQYLGTEILDEFFKRFKGAHSKVRTTLLDGKEVRQAGSPSLVGSAFPEGEMASPAVSVNPILSLEDSGNQKPHPSERIIQSELGVTGKAWISSFAPLRRCPSGGIQLFVGGSMIPLLPVEPERIARGYQSKGTLDLLDLGVGKNVASFLSWISNSKNVTLGHPMPPLQSPEDPQSQTFLFAETKPEILRQQRAPDSKYFASGIVLLKSPSGLLSLVPLWECQGLSRVRELAYFPEPEAMGKEYASDFGENPSSAIVTMVQPSQDPKIQTPLLDKSQEDKGRGQLGIKITMAPLVRDKVAQILEEKYGTSNELPEHLTFTRNAKLATAASIIRQTTTQEKLQDHQQTLPPQKSGFSQGPGKTTTGNPELRLPQTPQPNQTEQGRGWTQNQEGQASEESSENINTQGPGLGSVPPTGWLNPVFLVKLGTQRKISELEATSGHSWLCLEGGCWEVILQALDSFQDLKTTDVKSLPSRILSSRSKSLQMEAAGTVPSKDVQITEVSLGSLQLSPQRESFHSDWTTQSLISGPHFVDNFSLRPALPGNWTDPWSFDWFCDFEADLCGWQQNGTGAAWVLTQDQNSPSWRGSPSLESACHFPGGNHLSLQNQDSPQTVPKAVLISPILHGARWIRFWYGPLQPGMGTISVYVYSRAQFEWHLIWSSVAHQSSSWTWVEMKLWPSRKIQVMVKGVQGPEDGAHLSIDNLSVSSHQWSKGKTKLPCHSFKEALNKI